MALAANALTTVAALNTYMGTSLATDPAERLINVASNMIEKYCNRAFYRTVGIVEKVKGYGSERLVVSRTPLETITSIVIDGTTIDASEYSLEEAGAGFILNESGWDSTARSVDAAAPYTLPGTELSKYVVTYTGGYATIPPEVEEACLHLAKTFYKASTRDPSVSAESVGDASVQYAMSVVDGTPLMTNWVKALLAPYKRAV